MDPHRLFHHPLEAPRQSRRAGHPEQPARADSPGTGGPGGKGEREPQPEGRKQNVKSAQIRAIGRDHGMQEQRADGTPATPPTGADFINTEQPARTSSPEISALVQTSTTPFSLSLFSTLSFFTT